MSTRKQDPIKKITTAAGETRYRFIIDMGKRPTVGGINAASHTRPRLRPGPSGPRSSPIAPWHVGRAHQGHCEGSDPELAGRT